MGAGRFGIGAHARTARQDMLVALGEDDDLTRLDRDRLFADEVGEAAAFGDHVIRDQMPGARQDLRQDLLAWRLLGDPRGLGHDVEERGAGKPDRSQHIGKRVCNSSYSLRWTSGLSGRWVNASPIPDAVSSIADVRSFSPTPTMPRYRPYAGPAPPLR